MGNMKESEKLNSSNKKMEKTWKVLPHLALMKLWPRDALDGSSGVHVKMKNYFILKMKPILF